jgi:nucleotide-binding universal stress UspA family protein
MLPLRHILVPFDWSEASIRALDVAAALAREHNSQLVILHVVPLESLMYGPPPECYLTNLRNELSRISPTGTKTPAKHTLVEGSPAAAILAAARENHCDMIVMGTHGRTGLNRFLNGSVAEQVVRKAHCSVITVRAEDCIPGQVSRRA